MTSWSWAAVMRATMSLPERSQLPTTAVWLPPCAVACTTPPVTEVMFGTVTAKTLACTGSRVTVTTEPELE